MSNSHFPCLNVLYIADDPSKKIAEILNAESPDWTVWHRKDIPVMFGNDDTLTEYRTLWNADVCIMPYAKIPSDPLAKSYHWMKQAKDMQVPVIFYDSPSINARADWKPAYKMPKIQSELLEEDKNVQPLFMAALFARSIAHVLRCDTVDKFSDIKLSYMVTTALAQDLVYMGMNEDEKIQTAKSKKVDTDELNDRMDERLTRRHHIRNFYRGNFDPETRFSAIKIASNLIKKFSLG